MSLSDANVIQENSNTTTGTSHVVTLGSGTTAGNTVLIYAFPSGFSAVPSGFVTDAGGGGGLVGVYRKSDVAAAETSWTFSTASSIDISWYVKEVSNLDTEPLDVTSVGSNGSLVNGSTLSTGTTAQNAGLSVMVDVIFGSGGTGGTRAWSGYTNGFTEVADVSGTNNGIAVATKYQDGTTTTFESTATLASSAGMSGVARLVAYRAADAPLAAPLAYLTGYEWGTHGGMGQGGIANPHASTLLPSGTWGTTYLVQSSSARNSGYGLRIAVSATTCSVGTPTFSGAATMTFGFNVRVVSATGVAVVAQATISGGNLRVVYDGSTNKFGLQWSTNTPEYQSGTTATNTWVWIDVRCRVNSTSFHADWRIETGTNTYTDQTSPADFSATATTVAQIFLGAAGSSTLTADYDDFVVSRYYAAYPLGPHEVRIMVPATTGASVVGTSTNFSKFTANGTLAAWGSDAGALLDEVPPTVSASSDGVVQTAVATSDYMEFPMSNPSLASDEVLGGVRSVISTWGGTGTGTGTLWLAVSDGTTETVVDSGVTAYDGDSLTAVSATYPIWRNKFIPAPTGGWTPTAGNALVARVGKSSDATPDMGVSAVYLEYATRKAIDTVVHRLEDSTAVTTLRVNPYSSAAVSYVTVNSDPTRSARFRYWVGGVEQDPPVSLGGSRADVAPGGNQTVTINADAFGDVDQTNLDWV